MAKKQPARGARISWQSSQGTVEGTVVKTIETPTDIKGHHVAASPDNPEVVVKSAKTGALAAHKPEALTKKPR